MRRSAALFLVLIAAAIAGNLALAHGQTAGPDSIQVDMDVVYQTGGKVMMDVARPATPGPHPAVVTIGGDAFRTVARSTHETLIRKLAGRGYVAAAIDYRVGGRSQFPAPLQDVKAAVRFLRANAERFGIDPARICALGEAAGAPLALLTALRHRLRQRIEPRTAKRALLRRHAVGRQRFLARLCRQHDCQRELSAASGATRRWASDGCRTKPDAWPTATRS
jgi:acetyl esterase/lipase